MKKMLVILTMPLILLSCKHVKTERISEQANPVVQLVDTSIIAILPHDAQHMFCFENTQQATLSSDDLAILEGLLISCIEMYNLEQEKLLIEMSSNSPTHKFDKKDFLIDLAKYKRQYIAVINSSGEKEVWINCFCSAPTKNWREQLVVVKDGGNCYFNLKVNLTTGQCYDLMVNGYA